MDVSPHHAYTCISAWYISQSCILYILHLSPQITWFYTFYLRRRMYLTCYVDYNTDTPDVRDTFHCMGIVSTVTPYPQGQYSRATTRWDVASEQPSNIGQIDIVHYRPKIPDSMNKPYRIICQFLYARWKQDILWYGDVRPVLRPSIRPSCRPSVTLLIMTVSVHFLSNG
jgi:hypothetical protein